MIGALAEIGVAAHYVPLNDIASDKGKIGSAEEIRQRRGAAPRDDGLRHRRGQDAGSAAYRAEKMSDKGTRSANKRSGFDAVVDWNVAGGDPHRVRRLVPKALRHSGFQLHPGRVGCCKGFGGQQVRHSGVNKPGAVTGRTGWLGIPPAALVGDRVDVSLKPHGRQGL